MAELQLTRRVDPDEEKQRSTIQPEGTPSVYSPTVDTTASAQLELTPRNIEESREDPFAAEETITPEGTPEELPEEGKPFGDDVLIYTDNTPDEKVNDDYLKNDDKFLEAARIVFKMNRGRDHDANGKDSDLDLGEYGINMMGWFNYNITKMTVDAASLASKTDEQKAAFLYLMESYDDLGMSWAGLGRFAVGAGTDWTTYVGIGTFGIGKGISEGAKMATKVGLKALLSKAVRNTAVKGATAGATYATVDSVNRQTVKGEGISLGETAISTGIGATIGVILPTTARVISNKIGARLKIRRDAKAKKLKAENPQVKNTEEIIEPPISKGSPKEKVIQGEVIPKGSTADVIHESLEAVVQAVKKQSKRKPLAVSKNTGIRDTKLLIKLVEPITKLLKKAATTDGVKLQKYLEDASFTVAQMSALKAVAQDAAGQLNAKWNKVYKAALKEEDPIKAKTLHAEADELEKVASPLILLDDTLGTASGRDLQARQFLRQKRELKGTTIKSLRESGMTLVDAKKHLSKLNDKMDRALEQDARVSKIKSENNALRGKSELSEEIRIKKHELKLIEEAYEDSLLGWSGKLYGKVNFGIRAFNEFVISNVFSPYTIMINTLPSVAKTVYKPALNALTQYGPTGRALRKMVSEYNAMFLMMSSARKIAAFTFKYEPGSVLTGGFDKFIEDSGPVIAGKVGRSVRFFPKSVQSIDAFFEQIHYRAYVVGKAQDVAYEDGIKAGLKGSKLTTYVKKNIEKAIKKAYTGETDQMDSIQRAGITRGLTGEELNIFVRAKMKDKLNYGAAKNQAGKAYVQDLLFKRGFGKGIRNESTAGKLASGYEQLIKNNPVMRIVGQLFFRTPIRVFEEAVALTPGLNMLSPRFFRDIAGKNGVDRQVTAQGNATVSLVLTGSIATLYASGNISGSGHPNYRIQKQMEDAGHMPPYSIRLLDGSFFSYKYLDPWAFPIRVMVNSMEGVQRLHYEDEQGMNVDQGEVERVARYGSVAWASFTQSVADINLIQGATTIMDAVNKSGEPGAQDFWTKFLGEKAASPISNTYVKTRLQFQPQEKSPKSAMQRFLKKWDSDDKRLANSYTTTGIPREISSPLAKLWMFDTIKKDERHKQYREGEMEALKIVFKVTEATGWVPQTRFEHELFEGDMRLTMMPDGSMTIYDAFQKILRDETDISEEIIDMDDEVLGNSETSPARDYLQAVYRDANDLAAEILYERISDQDNSLEERLDLIEDRKDDVEEGLFDVIPPITAKNK